MSKTPDPATARQIEDWLAQTTRWLNDGLAAQMCGSSDEARTHYLHATEVMLKAAQLSTGTLKAYRLRLADEIRERATAIAAPRHVTAPTPTPPPHSPGLPKSDTAHPPHVKPAELAEDGKAAEWLVMEKPSERFDDVAGLEDVKEQIRLKLIYPFTHPEEAKRYGVRTGGGILLYGPPGTGKTMIARAIAGEVDAAYFAVKPSEIMSKWVGEAEQNIQLLFSEARKYPRAVIFIDEVESMVPRRRDSGSTVMQRVVPQILQELQGFEKRPGALLFVGATNEPWSLDPAIMRPGRFDEKIYVPLPDSVARRRLVELSLRNRPLAPEVSMDDLATRTEGYSGADIVNLCAKACAIPFIESVRSGVERDVLIADFEAVLAQVRPSVTAKDLVLYERFAAGAG